MRELGNTPETGFFTRTPGGGFNNRLALYLAPFLEVNSSAWSLPSFDVYIPMFCVTVTQRMYLTWFLVFLLYKKFDAQLDKLHSDSTQSPVLCLSVIHSPTSCPPVTRGPFYTDRDQEGSAANQNSKFSREMLVHTY